MAWVQHKTVGIIGAGRIGTAYARMMAEGHKCNIVYFDPYPNKFLEEYIADYSSLLESKGEAPITCRKIDSVEELLQTADVRILSLPSIFHMCPSNASLLNGLLHTDSCSEVVPVPLGLSQATALAKRRLQRWFS